MKVKRWNGEDRIRYARTLHVVMAYAVILFVEMSFAVLEHARIQDASQTVHVAIQCAILILDAIQIAVQKILQKEEGECNRWSTIVDRLSIYEKSNY